jgi:hypothetical protein
MPSQQGSLLLQEFRKMDDERNMASCGESSKGEREGYHLKNEALVGKAVHALPSKLDKLKSQLEMLVLIGGPKTTWTKLREMGVSAEDEHKSNEVASSESDSEEEAPTNAPPS